MRGKDAGSAWAGLQGEQAWMQALEPGDRASLIHITTLIATERRRAERLPAEVLLERAIAATGYDVAVLSRPGGQRRLANLRKLMRLARDFERYARSAAAFVRLAMIRIMLKRLTRQAHCS